MAVMKYLGSDGLYHVLPAYVSSQVQSVNGKTGIVELNYNDIHNLPEELDKKITAPTTGEAGQLLSRKADGTVEWKTVSTEAPSYIAKAFDKTQTYGVGEYVFYDNDLYKAKGFVPAHDFTPSEWEKVKVMEELVNQEVSLDAVAPKFNKSETYEAGDFVIQNNKLYKAKVAKAAGTDFVAANWEERNVVGLFEDNDDAHKTILNDMAADYDPAHAYAAGDFCIYNGQLYKANDNVTGTWNPAKWDATKVTNELGSVDLDAVARDWFVDETNRYQLGDFVIKDGLLYKLNSAGAAASDNHKVWNSGYWTSTNVGIEINDIHNELDTKKVDGTTLANAFMVGTAYTSGSMVSYNGKLYKAKVNVDPSGLTPPEQPTKWDEVKVVDLSANKLSATTLCPNWVAMPYTVGSSVTTPEGNYYIANAATTAADIPGTSTKWTPVTIQEKLNLKADDIDIAETFDGAKVYAIGALVMHNGDLYRAKVLHGADVSWDDANWERTNIAANIKDGMDTTLIAPNHSATSTYAEGQLVIHEDKLYRAKADIDPAKAWDDDDWEITNVAANLGGAASDFRPAFITAMNLLGEVLGFTYSYVDDPDNPGSKIDKIVLN